MSSSRPAPAHLADLVSRNATERPGHDAVRDLSGAAPLTLSWAALDAAVSAEAARLRAAGVRPGDRVAIGLPDGAAYCVAVFGALRADAIAVPFGTGSVTRELEIVFEQAAPVVVVAAAGDRVAAGCAQGCGARLLPPPDPAAPAPDAPATGGPADPERVALIVFTSGTTGRPRGVQLTHRALLANRAQAAELRPAPVNGVDRVLLALPLYHVYGFAAGLLQVCWMGATVVLPGPFDPERLLATVVEERVSVIAAVPSLFRSLLDLRDAPAEGPDRLRSAMGGVRLCTSGGAPLPSSWLADFRGATGLELHEGYGLSEGGPVITTNDLGRPAKPGSVGRPLPGIELRLVDAAGRPLSEPEPEPEPDELELEVGSEPDDDTGLIALRGPNLFSGYWPDGSGGPDADGWFTTADVGYLDADGDLFLVDRSSDLVIVNGFNVYPREIEQVVAELDAVAEVAVVGVPDDRTGEAVKAVVVAVPGAGLTVEQVDEHCAARLARFKRPTVVAFADELPRTPTGKIARRTLARM
ncbi:MULTISPECIES: class I adenylate-forming enzyme family protein [Pseudonocardia]|uniref:Long-chain-fatty-acid--CoA ligase n=2 Tax=Pseudonocardia TaxID=1847 RepID=A0A1Y2NAS7_PSEAH|nr:MULTISPECIES: AMP-binding protein [Pseudonocardia]OSY44177.1 Long-chain-fatty-acid--CoA ligase [Pseudonocardia autotrophica]TDN74093.1 long-chain acyl-CoA synthetase [Pseudonocardia autotrophica]BBG04851.1 long-chain acyl-CoA synthetase [Pseudonocardia autotrophica]GEC23507.1 long-chain acyl-CoA synthetase [Pseudonocardia saturnea]